MSRTAITEFGKQNKTKNMINFMILPCVQLCQNLQITLQFHTRQIMMTHSKLMEGYHAHFNANLIFSFYHAQLHNDLFSYKVRLNL